MSGMDVSITLHQPKRLEIGAGAAGRLAEWADSAERALVITSDATEHYVQRLGLGRGVTVVSDVPPEPDLPAFERVLHAARDVKPDLVVGLGGGSVLDVAKLVAALADSDKTLKDVAGPNRIDGRRIALAQVATTSGTGSEAGIRALITDPDTKSKIATESPYLLADIAILDPELTVSVPPAVTAATGIDALAHCVEAFTNVRAHDLIDGYARLGIGLVSRYLKRAVENGEDREARAGMMLASYYGGLCLGPVNTAAGHALSYPLGTRLSLPHGLANAIIFPHVLAFNKEARPEKTAEIATMLRLEENQLLESGYAFCEGLGVEMHLEKHGAERTTLGDWATEAHAIRRLMDNNPRDMTVEDVAGIYHAAF